MIGGHAIRICTSLAPASSKQRVLSRSCVPRTIESSQKRTRLPRSREELWMSFIFATNSRVACWEGVKERGHVGVYLVIARA